jgi:very-short-patch-repair endonuclease
VVALVLDHARTRPHESLGVIALGIQHAERIEAALRSVLAARPDRDALAPFFAESRDEGFFVKNLERVQGDERDAIILSVGYGKSADGRLLYRFGPINNAGGERRLNVAITRARSRLTLVSSFSNLDMDPEHSTAEGVRLLRRYLAYAATGGSDLGEKAHPLVALDAFEAHAQEQLVKLALPVTAHYGVSGYRIDFALAHPARPERMVLAVEVDGPSYHAARTSRERDRLRQEVLERLGWRFHRSWSTAWFRDPAAEAERVAGVWRAAVAGIDAAADRDGSVTPAAVPDEPDIPPPPPALRNGRKPVPGDGRAIGEYSDRELIALIAWIRSDTLLRTDDELLDEAVKQLGYKRRGPRIVERVQRAIDATQPKG